MEQEVILTKAENDYAHYIYTEYTEPTTGTAHEATIGHTVCSVFLWLMNDALLWRNKICGTDAITVYRKLAKSS